MLIDVIFHSATGLKKKYNMSIEHNAYIYTVYKALQKLLPQCRDYTMIYKGEQINKHDKISDYNIKSGSVVIILLHKQRRRDGLELVDELSRFDQRLVGTGI